MTPAVEVRSLSKTYRANFGRQTIPALREVSLDVREGEVFALLGLNGAGKSTLIRCILDLVRPDSGEVRLFGQSLREYCRDAGIGYLPESFWVRKGMTGVQTLRFLGELSNLKRDQRSSLIEEILATAGLAEFADRKVETYSKGMILRLGIAQALLHKPRIVFLDEPTDGLDPLGRKMIRDLIRDLAKQGVTVFLNSHLLSEVELVADRIAIVHRGRLVISGILKELLPAERPLPSVGASLEELFFAFLEEKR